ncbi:MAG: hypothetical protein ACRENY_08720 [Candidatus Dormibacteria bacterium]
MTDPGAAPGQGLPPVTQTVVGSMALVIAGGIYLAAYLPLQAPLLAPVILLAGGGLLLLAAVAMLLRIREFAWDRFWQVGGWALLAYVVISGMIEYVLLMDQTSGALLALFTITLVIFAVDIPIVLAFSVASHQEVQHSPSR